MDNFKFSFLSRGQLESLNLDKIFLSLLKILPCKEDYVVYVVRKSSLQKSVSTEVKWWFFRRGEAGVPAENLSVQRREPTNSTHI